MSRIPVDRADGDAVVMDTSNPPSIAPMGLTMTLFGGFLWIVLISPTLAETDAYRYVAGILAVIGLYYYLKLPVRPRTDWLGWLCMGWSAYVMIRFAIIYAVTPHHDIGASDWLYAFPFFFPILGFAYGLYARHMERIVAAFFAIALVMLAVTTHYRLVLDGDTVKPLIMNNQIHGAVACGTLLIGAFFWWLHYVTGASRGRAIARFAFVATPLIILLCLFDIYGAKSKGVWLALTITLPVMALITLGHFRLKTGLVIVACAAVVLLGGIYAVRHNLDKTAGPTLSSAVTMLKEIGDGGDVHGVVSGTIASDETPVSMDERLQLWFNAWQVFSSAPLFGWGNEWLERWHQTRYANVQYTLLHNGYLETLVRFGVVGSAVLLFMLMTFIRSVRRAWRAGIIPAAAMQAYLVILFFFALTLLSNSNNRLAIGESLALASSAFACWCNMQLRTGTNTMPREFRAPREATAANG